MRHYFFHNTKNTARLYEKTMERCFRYIKFLPISVFIESYAIT